jgi:hypothetical protein
MIDKDESIDLSYLVSDKISGIMVIKLNIL